MRNNHNQTVVAPDEAELLEAETAHLSVNEPMTPDLQVLYGEYSEGQQDIVEEAAKHVTAQDAYLLKDKKAFDNLVRLNGYMGEQFTDAMIRADFTEARAIGRPCEDLVRRFIRQRRQRLMLVSDKVEERAALKQLNEAGKSLYPRPKKDESKLNLIFRLLTSEKTKITQAKDQDEGLPMVTGTLFGNSID